jgi:D-lactate dehydrogenase
MKIAFFSTQKFEKIYFEQASKDHDIEYFYIPLNANTASLIDGHEAVCVFVNDMIDLACVQILQQKKIKFIALRCAGYNNIDLDACHQAHIKVVNVPQYSPHAVAEHALALLLCLNRKIHKAYARIKEGNFDLNGLQGFDLCHKTVGIIGLGAIGQVFAKICHGLDCHIMGYDPIKKDIPYIHWTDLNTLFKTADIISLHCPLNEKTHHIINHQSIQNMKKNVVIINTGRGALIDSKALIHALKKQKISGVALDVYELESGIFFYDHSMDIIQDDNLMRLTTFPNVLITSHQGFLTHEALEHIAQTTMQNIHQLHSGKNCPNSL